MTEVHPIEAESYRILRSRIDLSALPPLTRAVTERVIHATADFDYVTDLVCDEAALAAGVAALRRDAPVIADVAMVASGIANGGSVMTPYLIQSVRSANLDVIQSAPDPVELSQAVSQQTASILTKMMVSVVQNGSGARAQIPGVEVAGKTGTAQHDLKKPPHAWFISFAPATDPKVAVAVVVEDGGVTGSEIGGGRVAAPIARAVMQAVLGR